MAKAKKKLVFFCKECGFESPKWLGQCPGCHEWDSFAEAPAAGNVTESIKGRLPGSVHRTPAKLNEVQAGEEERINTGIEELDRVLGGGIGGRRPWHWQIYSFVTDVQAFVWTGA